jgi:hypothetical protein
MGLVRGQAVSLVSRYGQERRLDAFLVVPFDMPDGMCATYFPEANPLIPWNSYADRSNTPTSKSVIVEVVP